MTDELFSILIAPSELQDEIESIESKIKAYRDKMLPSAIRYDSDKVKSSPKDIMPEYVAKIEGLSNLKEKKIIEQFKALNRVEALAEHLTGTEKRIIIMRYMENREYEEIAEILYMSERQMFNYRKSAIEKLEKISVNCSRS